MGAATSPAEVAQGAEVEAKVDAVVIGAGVVGCAVAYELANRGIAPWVLERGPRIAEGVTSRNSGVIHAGIYYPPGSRKAAACVRGNALLYEWCERRQVPHRRVGKWILANREEAAELAALFENARASGATGLTWHDSLPAGLEGVRAELGIFSAGTGIVDPYEYSLSLQRAAEEKGAQFCLKTRVSRIERVLGAYALHTDRGTVVTDRVVNAAGLYSDEVARLVGVTKYLLHPCRGDYFRFASPHRFPHLLYPVKKRGSPGLGVHLTLALDGAYRLGPDAYYVGGKEEFEDPSDLEARQGRFFEAASRYLRIDRPEQLVYDSCGIRPKLRSPQDPDERDFIISADLPGFVNLVGIESPGLTASLSLAEDVARMIS